MARILITGASGFIGGYLVSQALGKGHDVTAALRKGSNTDRLKDKRLKLLDFPLGDAEAMAQVLQDTQRFDWVIHNAGVTKALTKEAYREGNSNNTRRFVQALQNADVVPDKFLFVSSLAAMGAPALQAAAIQEHQTPQPLTPYGESKLEAEQFLVSTGHFPWVVVQPTAVYGPWERDILTFIQLANKGLELSIGRQSQRLSFIHAHDVASAVYRILETKTAIHRKYILSDGKAYTTEDLGAAVRQALGIKKTIKIRLPLGLVRQVATIADAWGRLKNKPAALSRDKIPELAAENWHCDASPLIQELQFQPEYDLYNGMQQTVQWYRTKGWI
jgi:nucleoside-diphosphate-sugar epimerase